MAIVYKHFRKTDDTLFYVGIGKNKSRAFSKKSRNDLWKNIVKKYDYYVVIVVDNITIEEATRIEKELIEENGRIDLGTGVLANMTSGGDGHLNMSEATRQKIINKLTGSKQSQYTKDKRAAILRQVYKDRPELVELKRAQTTELIKNGILKLRTGIPSPKKGKPFAGDKEKLSHSLKEHYKNNVIWNKNNFKVSQYDTYDNYICSFESHHDAALLIGGLPKRILECCRGIRTLHKGFRWKFCEDK